ncbi:MAG: methyltransferase domain-containing protein [Betaproteobacteria bacterium]|nr:methyltransferase domain-containing protein [Betaproteobacteria bacterium]NBY06277.1 methyltransferase domain-containing protein [Betaproteobacteria bacterium]
MPQNHFSQRRFALISAALSCLALTWAAPARAQDPANFQALLAGPQRSPANVVRDPYRHPAETLAFFGIQAHHTVVEILPGSGGYYLEILAPWLREKGRYIAANRDQSLPQYIADQQKLLERLKAEPQLYDQVQVTAFRADNHPIAAAGSADVVISFRNLHNWMEREEVVESLRAFHKALKPGGVLGIVDHRGRNDRPQAQQMASGYVREDVAIALIEANGFALTGRSEVNANPKDTKDHPEGVWSLPPTYRMKDVDRARFQTIGESDRFTLRFVKR